MNIKQLSEPLAPEKIHWRIGATNQKKIAKAKNDPKARPTKGIALAYIDARDVMDRLDDVCGPENWKDSYRDDHGTTMCTLSIRIGDEWVSKEDGSGDTDVEAEKGAVSKALVRAAVKWGIGRYLYDVKSPWVSINDYGDIDPNDMRKLINLLPNAPKQQAPKAETPSDAPSEQDDMAKELGDLITTIEQITTMNNLQGLWATARLKKFWADATDEQRKKLDAAKNAKKATLEMAA